LSAKSGLMKKIFSTIWHLWALLGIALMTLFWAIVASVLFVLFVKVSDRVLYATFKFCSKAYAICCLIWMGIYVKVDWRYKPKRKEKLIVIANHTSFLDIYALFATFPGVITFMGKEELGKFPVFGFIYKKMIITVNRKSRASRVESVKQSKEWLDKGFSLCIYPEGGIPKTDTILDGFKKGAFVLALEVNTPIIPILTPDNKDAFPYSISKGRPGVIRMVYDKPVELNESKPLEEWMDYFHKRMKEDLELLKK